MSSCYIPVNKGYQRQDDSFLRKKNICMGLEGWQVKLYDPSLTCTNLSASELTRMWADAQRDGRPGEYRWRPLRQFCSSILCTTPQSFLTSPAGVPCSNAANTGERKTWTQSEFCTWQNSVRGQEPPRIYTWCTSRGDYQTSFKVWLASGERRRCSNEAKTRNPLKFARVPQTPKPISAVGGPTFTILRGHVWEILTLNNFFPISRYMR